MSDRPLDPAAKMRLACELFEAGRDLMRQKLRRDHPHLDDVAIERRLAEWVATRPGAEHGDTIGRPRKLPESA